MNPSGKIVFSSGRSVDFDIWCLDLSHQSLTQLTRGDNLNNYPCLSGDGKKVVYISTQEDLIPSLWIMDSNGNSKKRLTFDTYCQSPAFSPDGRSIIFCANLNDGNNIDIFRLALDDFNSKPELLISLPGLDSSPSLSPCGNKLLFCSQKNSHNSEILELDIASKTTTSLCSHAANNKHPKYSPDGKQIAFVSYREEYDISGYAQKEEQIQEAVKVNDIPTVNKLILELHGMTADSEIFVANADGSNLRQITKNKGSDLSPCWSPCGNFICYCAAASGQEGETERLRIVRVSDGAAIPLKYDRSALEAEIAATELLNKSIFQKIVPDWIERKFLPKSYFGEERSPSWSI